jgi:PAS domain S-box-containing protein
VSDRTDSALLERRLERLRTLNRLMRLVSTSLDLDDVLAEIARAAVELTDAIFASFWLADDTARTLRLGAFSDEALAEQTQAPDLSLRELPYGEGIAGRVALSREPLNVDDVFVDGRAASLAWCQRLGVTSILGVPVLRGDHLLAVLALNGGAPFRLDVHEAELLEIFLAQAAVAIHNAALYASVRLSQEQLQAVVDYSPTSISLKDPLGRYLLTNRRWKEIRGFDPEAPAADDETLGRTDHELFPREMADSIRANDLRVLAGGQAIEYEVPLERDGQSLVYLAVKFPLFDQFGALYATGTISTDITARKRWEEGIEASLEAQRAANEQLERLSRAKSDFVAVVSHELRTPLTGIQGFSELMSDERFNREQIEQFAVAINRETRRLNRLITEVLDLDRMESGQMRLKLEAVDLREIVEEVVGRTRPTSPAHQIRCQIDAALPMLAGDRDKLCQVLLNLLSNAIKYSPDGGEVLVGAGAGPPDEPPSAHLWVRDCGLGIPPEALDTVFERYTRVESASHQGIQGTGLGLPIVRQVVELHGGRVWAESEVGRGSTFHVALPVAGRRSDG